MKVAISVPDPLFREAERHAKRTRKTRSRLYVEAISEYLARHSPDEVTEAMNQVVDQLQEPTNEFLQKAARATFERTEW